MTLVVSVHDLMHKPGNMRELVLTHELQANLGTELIFVPKGEVIELDIRLESVHEGILVTASAETDAQAECARCLDPVAIPLSIELQELFHYRAEGEDDFEVISEAVDLEQSLIDAVVLELPLKPLCDEDCPGLCPGCGERLAKGEQHEHEIEIDPRFSALKDFGKD